jgi:hypothetical protein
MDSLTETKTMVHGFGRSSNTADSGNFVMLNMDAVTGNTNGTTTVSPPDSDVDDDDDDAAVAAAVAVAVAVARGDSSASVIADEQSVDTTLLANSVGSVVGPKQDAFLRSFTFSVAAAAAAAADGNGAKKGKNGSDLINNLSWDITFADPISVFKFADPVSVISSSASILSSSTPSSEGQGRQRSGRMSKMMNAAKTSMNNRRSSFSKQKAVTIASIDGHFALSHICVGDAVTRINGKKIGPSYNAQRCSDLINNICSNNNNERGGGGYGNVKNKNNDNGILSIQTGNENGLDTVLQATVIKPNPKSTAKQLGLEVWWWRGLMVRDIKPNSLFSMSGLKMDDELESINGISLTYNDKITTKDFNRIVQELPCDITLVVKRNKHRVTGGFE